VDAGSRRVLRWVLGVGGILGFPCATSMLLVNQAAYGDSTAAANLAMKFPSWAQLGAAPPAAFGMLVVGLLCALLLVVGSWPIKVCAALAAAWYVYALVAFGSGSYWAQEAQSAFDYTPFRIGGLVSVIALLVVSVVALVVAVHPTVPYLTPGSTE